MADRASKEAFVTLATNDTYSLGCLVLGSSLRRVGTTRKLVVMVTDGVSPAMRTQLSNVFDMIEEVNLLDSHDEKNLGLLGRPDLNVTFTKLHCWCLTQFDKCIFMDADTLVIQNVDELFDREELSAAPDAGWPDCFNSGVFVFKPSEETYNSLLNFALSKGSFDGGDQGLLNMYFRNWATEDISKHLPFIYNVVSQAFYSYLPAFTQFKNNVKIVHFIGATKPWHHTYDTTTGKVTPLPGTGHSQEFLQMWWNIFMEMVQPSLDPSLREQLAIRLARTNVQETIAITPVSLASSVDTQHPYEGVPPPSDLPPPSEPIKSEESPSHPTPPEETTVHMVYPYIPPDVDKVSYEKHTIEDMEKSPTSESERHVVEVPLVTRKYTHLESHYSEEPISYLGPEDTTETVLETPIVVEKWSEVNVKRAKFEEEKRLEEERKRYEEQKRLEEEKRVKEQGQFDEQLRLEQQRTEEQNRLKQEKRLEEMRLEEDRKLAEQKQIEEERQRVENLRDSETIHSVDLNKNGSSENVELKGGLVGELALLSIKDVTTTRQLSDAERKLNWEKGQIDYLGKDSFDNIQQKLDEAINSKTPKDVSETTQKSPFSIKVESKVKTAPKEPKV